MFYVYVLLCLKESFYIGYSENLRQRIKSHLNRQVISTRNKSPLRLIYYEAFSHKQDAKARERFLKSGSGHKFLKKQLVNCLKENV